MSVNFTDNSAQYLAEYDAACRAALCETGGFSAASRRL